MDEDNRKNALSWDWVRDRIFLSIVNEKDIHDDEPYIELIGDLSLIYKIALDFGPDTMTSMRFKMKLVRHWQSQYPTVTESNSFKAVFEVAKSNTGRMFPPVYERIPGGNSADAISDHFALDTPAAILVTTRGYVNGAMAVFNSYVLDGIAEEYDDELLLALTSPYESFVAPVHGDFTVEGIKDILKSSDPLSTHLYRYDYKTSNITVLDADENEKENQNDTNK